MYNYTLILQKLKKKYLKAQKTLFKRLLISSILATDMAKHVKLLEKFTKRVQITKKAQDDPNFLNENKNILEELILSDKKFDDKRVK